MIDARPAGSPRIRNLLSQVEAIGLEKLDEIETLWREIDETDGDRLKWASEDEIDLIRLMLTHSVINLQIRRERAQ